MPGFSLEPDEHMRWIYDYRHPDYHSDRARDLRERRAAALRNAPRWMVEQAALNDDLRKATPIEDEPCETCNGTGQVCTGTSGSELDGNAMELERCPSCGYGAE